MGLPLPLHTSPDTNVEVASLGAHALLARDPTLLLLAPPLLFRSGNLRFFLRALSILQHLLHVGLCKGPGNRGKEQGSRGRGCPRALL